VRIHGTKHLGPGDYNHNGPRGRFDHHDAISPPVNDPAHGIYYAADNLKGCIIEVFGDTGVIEPAGYGVAVVEPTRDLTLLDLTGDRAWHAGTIAAITKDADRTASQAWARFFYTTYRSLDGISYGNAHDDAAAYALFERAGHLNIVEHKLLADPDLDAELKDLAITLNMLLVT
jgi:hypothetical protein